MKKYNKIENYFVDKTMLKKYKKGLLNENDIVELSNNMADDIKCNINLEMDLDMFNGALVVIKNSIFDNVKIYNGVSSQFIDESLIKNCHVIFKNTVIRCGDISLNKKSTVELKDDSTIDMGNIYASYIELSDIENHNTYRGSIWIGNQNTNEIKLFNINSNIHYNLRSKNVNISSCNINTSSIKCDKLIIDYSNLYIYIDVYGGHIFSKELIMGNSKLIEDFGFINKNLFTTKIKNININGDSYINLSNVKSKYLSIEKGNTLSINKSNIHTSFLTIYENAGLYKSEIDDESKLNIKDGIILYKNASLSIDDICCQNTSNDVEYIQPELLREERKTLVKTLFMVRNKCNRKSIKDLK